MIKWPMRRWRMVLGSQIAYLILVCNLAGLLVMLAGVILFGELRSGTELARARVHALRIEAELIASVVANMAVPGFPARRLGIRGDRAQKVLLQVRPPERVRVRVFGLDEGVISDSRMLDDQIVSSELFSRVDAGRKALIAAARRSLMPWEVDGLVQVDGHAEELARALGGRIAGSERIGEVGEYLISVTVPVRRISKVVGALTIESADVHAVIRAQREGLLPVVLVALLVVLATSTYLTVRVATPLRNLASAADRVRTGRSRQLESRDSGNRRDEIGHLARALEAMTGALTSRAEGNARFAADVAHELKNPLTSIRSAVETLGAVDEAPVRERMQSLILQDVYRMDRLITDITNAGRVEAELASEDNKRFDLAPILRDIVDVYRQTSSEHGLELEALPEQGLFVMGNPDALAQVVRNLVDNAFSFSPEGGKITIHACISADRKDVILQVRDEGPGIPEESREKIFQRFYSDRDVSMEQGHSGLGLSIADHIIRAHGGDIRAENIRREGKVIGAQLSVCLPHATGSRSAQYL